MGYAILTQDSHGVTQDSYALHLHTHLTANEIVKYKQALKYRYIPVRSVYNLSLNITVLRDDHQHIFSS